MTNAILDLAILIPVWIFITAALLRASFYRGYFFQKERNNGKDPRTILRKEFPRIWRIM